MQHYAPILNAIDNGVYTPNQHRTALKQRGGNAANIPTTRTFIAQYTLFTVTDKDVTNRTAK